MTLITTIGGKNNERSARIFLSFVKSIGVVRVQSTTLTGNKRAINLFEKAKFKEEGVLAKYEPNKHDQDSLMFALIL